MRIALLLQHAPVKLGSLEDWLVEMAAEAARRGHRLDVWSDGPVHPEVQRRLSDSGAGWRDLAGEMGRPFRARSALARGYDVAHLNFIWPRSRALHIAWAAIPCRLIYVDHLSDFVGRKDRYPGLKLILNRVIMARAAAIVTVSDYLRERAPARFGIAAARVRTIHNGIAIERYPVRAAAPEPGPLRLVAVANLIPDKGLDVLLRAIAQAGSVVDELAIVGEGPELGALQALAAELRLHPRIRFLGRRDDVPALLAGADAFVHPAVWGEAFGLTVAEGMAAGCAVIASRVGAIPEIVEDGRSGLLVPPGDVGALAAALLRLHNDRELRRALGTAARQRIEQRFTLARMVAAHLDTCEEVAS